MVFQRSMLDWVVHLANMSTMCILLYMKLIWCNGFQRSMLDWRREAQDQSVMKLMQCTGFPEIYAQLEEGVGSVCHETFAV